MASSETMTSIHSFAYSYQCFQKGFVKICKTSKCHNLTFQQIFIKFLLFCMKFFTLSSEIKLNLSWISPLIQMHACSRGSLSLCQNMGKYPVLSTKMADRKVVHPSTSSHSSKLLFMIFFFCNLWSQEVCYIVSLLLKYL